MEPQIEQTIANIIVEGEKIFVTGSNFQPQAFNEVVGYVVKSDINSIEIQIHEEYVVQQLGVAGDGYVLLELRDHESTERTIVRCKHQGRGRFILKKTRIVKGVQLRKYTRVDAKVNYAVQSVDAKGIPTTALSCMPERTSVISGGGLQFYCRTNLDVNSFLLMTLDLHDFGTIKTDARVVRTEEFSKENQIYSIAVEFIGLRDSDRQKIISFVEKKLGGIKLCGTFSHKS
jgi:hypothetical protein